MKKEIKEYRFKGKLPEVYLGYFCDLVITQFFISNPEYFETEGIFRISSLACDIQKF